MNSYVETVGIPTNPQEIGETMERVTFEQMVAGSAKLENGNYKTDFIVPEMHCAGCIGSVERKLSALNFVTQIRANLSLRTVSITWDPDLGRITEASKALDSIGFEHHLSDPDEETSNKDETGRGLLFSLAVAGFAAANIMLLSVSVWSGADLETTQLFHLISGLIAIPAIAIAGRPFFSSALKAVSSGRLNMDVPISLAVILAAAMSAYESLTGGEEAYFDASVTLLFFLLIGRYLDHLIRQKARNSVDRLSTLSAKNGVLINQDGEVDYVELKDIRPGMRLRVFAGERFPVNARILSGRTDLDRSHVTGESESAIGSEGDYVEAGTLNMSASVDVEAMTSADGSFLAEMRKMMEAAEKGRGSYVRIADRMARIYAPAVHLLALLTFIGWLIVSGGDWHTSIYIAIAVLIVTCPCALGLAVPVAHVVGASRLMQNGIMMRDGTAIERLNEVDAVVFDKTGTLTHGHPVVLSVSNVPDDQGQLISALAAASNHPVSQAIHRQFADKAGIQLSDVQEIPGLGLQADHGGKVLRLGKPAWVAEIASNAEIPIPENCSTGFASSGKNAVWFELEDQVRSDAALAISTLKGLVSDIEILSGDRDTKVSQVANAIGLDQYLANQTPADKIKRIEAHLSKGRKPLMVGDGINDAPALAAGYVSMVPASASDVGRHAADFVFTRNSLSAVPFAITIARYTDRIVRQNFALAIAYNCIAVPLAMTGYVTPLIAAIAMSASSIVVVSNSLRINLAQRKTALKNQSTPGASAKLLEGAA